MSFKSILAAAAVTVSMWSGIPAVATEKPLLNIDGVISVEDLNADLTAFVDGYFALHPAPRNSMDPQEFNDTVDHIRSQLTKPMTRLEAWRLFSLLNPVFGDAHAGIIIPKRASIIKARLAAGERILPFSVRVGFDNRLYLKKAFEGVASVPAHAEILSIDGRAATDIVNDMLRHTHGDTSRFRRELLGRRFAEQYWALYGTIDTIDVTFDGVQGSVTVAGADQLPPERAPDRPFEEFFSYRIMDGNTGYLRVATFNRKYKDQFLRLSEEAFSAFKDAQVKNVIIDIRDNGGGGNSLWQQGIMPYIADKPYKYVSSYKAMVTKDNADPGDVVGSIVSGEYNKMKDPDLDNPLKFKGETYIMIGAMTYSSAIHFSISAQDYEIAKVAGTPSGGRSATTGNVTDIELPATGLNAFAPVLLFSRPGGGDGELSVQPDLWIHEDPSDPTVALKRLLAKINE